MSFTYAQLKTALQDYTETRETSFVQNLPVFIQLAEERILKHVRLNLFQKNVSGTMATGNQYLALPTDFLSAFSLSIIAPSGKEFLLQKELDFIQTYNPDASVTGQPKYFATFDVTNLLLAPTPNDNYVTELHYFYRPQSLTAGAEDGTTWLSVNAPIAMLYGSLVEAYTYLKGDADLMQNYSNRFVEALSRLKDLGEAKEPTTDYRSGRQTIPRT